MDWISWIDFNFWLAAALAEGTSVVEVLGIDVAKIIAQVVAFGVFVAVLQFFAYKPVLKLLEERRERIAESLEKASKIEAALADAEASRRRILQQANEQAQKLIDEATKTASAQAEKRLQEAVAQAEAMIKKAEAVIAQERDKMLAEVRTEVARLVVDTTAKVTGKVLTLEDQKRLNDEAVRSLAA